MVRVLLADDHRLFTDLVETLLARGGFDVVATATAPAEALRHLRSERPTLCLVDPITLDPLDPLGLLGRLAQEMRTRTVVLTDHPDRRLTAAAALFGAAGVISKGVSGDALLAALRRVAVGEPVPSGEPDLEVPAGPLARLRPRERECLALLAAGVSTSGMAAAMGVSPTTVRSHVRSVLATLGVHTRLAAASVALRYGLPAHHPGVERAAG